MGHSHFHLTNRETEPLNEDKQWIQAGATGQELVPLTLPLRSTTSLRASLELQRGSREGGREAEGKRGPPAGIQRYHS